MGVGVGGGGGRGDAQNDQKLHENCKINILGQTKGRIWGGGADFSGYRGLPQSPPLRETLGCVEGCGRWGLQTPSQPVTWVCTNFY